MSSACGPGDNVAADGVIVSGQGSFNQANITGESLPVDKKPGDEVFAGTQNLTGALEIRVTRAGQDTTLGKVRDLILAAEKTKLPIMRHHRPIHGFLHASGAGDRRAGLGLHPRFEPGHRHLHRLLPVRLYSRHAQRDGGRALGRGPPGDSHQERRRHRDWRRAINAFVFDKTGTLTTGRLAVSRLAPLAGTPPAELLRLAASAEKYSNHPAAKALAPVGR